MYLFNNDIYGFPRDPMNQIEEGLFLGNVDSAENAELIRSNNITKIVSILESFYLSNVFEGVEYHRIAIQDSITSNILKHLPNAIRFISDAQKNGHNVLVHCAAGISRSSSVVIAYLMVKYNKSYMEIREFVNQKRRGICPNSGFERQLQSIDVDQYKAYL